MEVAELFLLGAALLVFGDLVQLVNSKKGSAQKIGVPMAPLASLLVIGSYLLLAQAFVANNFRYEEVYLYSSSGLPVLGRLYASWASSSGSWLFLSSLFASGYLITRFRMRDRELSLKTFEVLDILFIFFIFVVLLQSPFHLLPEAQMDGRGLNPLLKTPWMLIHPPIVFIGYVLIFFSFAFTFDAFGSEDPSISKLVRMFSQLSWLFLTLGIALGGLWAYEVLGWGGYWAWDPVETASLIPWITLTAYFHLTTAISGRRTSSRELMVMVSSALVILATAITRGGFTVSVHAFGASPVGFVLVLLIGFTAAYFVYSQRKSGSPLFDFNIDTASVHSSAISLSFISLIAIAAVCSWGLLFPVVSGLVGGGSAGIDAGFFNKWCYPFVLVFVASLIGCHLSSTLTMKKYAGILGVLLVTGVVAALFRFPSPNMSANLGVPFALFALGAVVYSTLDTVVGKRSSGVLLGRNFIHLGVVFIVLGILLGSTAVSDYGELMVRPGSTLEIGDISVEFGDFEIIEPFGNVHTASADACCNPEATGLEIPVTVVMGGGNLKGNLKIFLYSLHGIVSRPLVLRSLEQDVYIVMHQTQPVYYSLVHTMLGMPMAPAEFAVNVKTFPLINLIWLGVILMSAGILFPLFRKHRAGI